MKLEFILGLAGLSLFGGATDAVLTTETAADSSPTNVNARYIIESVNILGSESKALKQIPPG